MTQHPLIFHLYLSRLLLFPVSPPLLCLCHFLLASFSPLTKHFHNECSFTSPIFHLYKWSFLPLSFTFLALSITVLMPYILLSYPIVHYLTGVACDSWQPCRERQARTRWTWTSSVAWRTAWLQRPTRGGSAAWSRRNSSWAANCKVRLTKESAWVCVQVWITNMHTKTLQFKDESEGRH